MITAKALLTQPLKAERQFAATTGSEHHMLLDDAAGGTGPKPIELVATALAGCTAFDVITILRQKYHQKVTGYEVRVEADQAERPPQVFTAVRLHHVVTGFEIDPAAIEEAIRLSEEKYCSVGAMVKQTASLHTTYEIVEEKTQWLAPTPATVQGGKPPMRICGQHAGKLNQSPSKTIVRFRGASRFAANRVLIALLALSVP